METSTRTGTYRPGSESQMTAVPGTLVATRERRGRTAKQIADHLGRSASFVSRAERGDLPITGPDLRAYSDALDVTPELLCVELPQEPVEGVHFRSQAVSKRLRKQLEHHANYLGWIIDQLATAADMNAHFPRVLPEIDAHLLDQGPEEAAQIVRRYWRLSGPVQDIALLLEQTGVFILPMPPEITTKVDAITVRCEGVAEAIILLAGDRPAARQRHTLAHELGHLVMDQATRMPLGLNEVEERANRFAGEFLAPYDELRDDLRDVTPSHLDVVQALSSQWGVSIPSLIRRTYLDGGITESQYRYWFRTLNARNLLRGNTTAAPPVKPTAAGDFLLAVRDLRYSAADIVDITHTRPRELQETFGHHWPFEYLRPQLREVLSLA